MRKLQQEIQSPQFLTWKSKFFNRPWDEASDARDERACRFDDGAGTSLARSWERMNGANGTGQGSNFPPQDRLIGGIRRTEILDSKIECLKILALSLLREIASVEKVGEGLRNETIDLQAEVRRFEVELIRSALIQTGGRQRQAARLLGTKITTLNTKIKRYKIKVPQTDGPPFD